MFKPLLVLSLVSSLSSLAADSSWSAPLLTVGNRWIMTDAANEFEVSIGKVSPLAGAQDLLRALRVRKSQ
jgi:hypothetical protein